MKKKSKAIILILSSFLLILVVFGVYNIYKPSFKIKSEKIEENYTIVNGDKTSIGNLYDLDILYSGKVTSELANKYANNITAPEGTSVINIKFYSTYDDQLESQPYETVKYEIRIIL